MRRLLNLGCSVFLLFFSNGTSQILQGNVEIKVDQGIIFGNDAFELTKTGSLRFDAEGNFNDADLILLNTLCPVCIGCCCSWEIGSSRPFYRSKIHYNSTNFTQILDLNDSTKFQLIEGTEDQFGKELPHTGIIPVDGKYLVFKNKLNKYILVKPDNTTQFIPDFSNPMKQCTNGFKGTWVLQSNSNSPFFPAASNRTIEKHSYSEYNKFNYSNYFQVNGRKFKVNTNQIKFENPAHKNN